MDKNNPSEQNPQTAGTPIAVTTDSDKDNNQSQQPANPGATTDPPKPDLPQEKNDAAEQEKQEQQSRPKAQQPSKEKNKPQASPRQHHRPPAVILVAILIAAILAIITILVFINTDKAQAPAVDGDTAEQQDNINTPQAVNEAADAVDQAVESTDSENDFPEDELSDQSLEL